MSKQLAIQVTEWRQDSLDGAAVTEVPIPEPQAGEALVRILLRPVNPTDLVTLHGARAATIKLPTIPGSEGVGIIEQPAASSTKFSKGQRVVGCSFGSAHSGQGTWQQFLAVPEANLLPVPDSVPNHFAAQFYVNPVTAFGLVEALAAPQGEWIIQTAAGSVLGRQLIVLAKRKGVRTINIIRRSAQRDELLQLGADEVIATDSEDIKERVDEITGGKGAWAAADAIAGDTSAQLMGCIRTGGSVYVYGALSGLVANAPVLDLLSGKTLTGFSLPIWRKAYDARGGPTAGSEVMKLLEDNVIQPLTGKTYRLEDFKEAIKASTEIGHGGKILLEG
ncbi:hypothetical protein WJX74_001835 [Apatococcus lobatus]|uniref:Enoyl reductase (ER) domain-containing protein n=2 Tax=Apatococcus TaxID=904362 RepID=A0AAW1T9K2_9CHLO